MSRNSSRVQAEPSTPQASQPREVARRTANTEFVELPSGGKFYPKDHPLHNQEVVEIRFMTARDEDILSSPTLLRKGLALDKFTQGILVDQTIKVEDLLIADKSAIMIAARITGYGSDYRVSVRCPECETEGEHEIDLENYSRWFIEAECDDALFTPTDDGTFKATLPVSQQEITVRLLTSKDEKRMEKVLESKRKNKLAESPTTDLLKAITVSIGDVRDRNQLAEVIMDLPARDSFFVRRNYTKIVPKIEMKENLECMYCGTETETEVPLGATFFWPDE
tara:strand:+ start:51 stop:890 length:840 start_codon:yes stop_codon:yes gene_type:complete